MLFYDKLKQAISKQKTKSELDKHYDEIELEKGDFLAMVIAAFITFTPILLVTMLVIYGLLWFLFVGF